MTSGFKITTWMEGWSDDDHAAYRDAWNQATASDANKDSGACSRAWLNLVLTAAQDADTGRWARDVLADMQRRGALESWKAAPIKPVITRKGRAFTAVAAAKIYDTKTLRDINVQTELFDMDRDQLNRQSRLNDDQAATFHGKSALAKRLVELIDDAIAAGAQPTVTPREAAAFLSIDLAVWCAA